MISIVIPTHNRLFELRNSLKSIFEQTVLPYEVIVIDDGSIEPISLDVFDGAPSNLKTKLLRNEESKGANNARNRGVKTSKGEWISFLDDDDQFINTKIESINDIINANLNLDVIYHDAFVHMVNEGVTYRTKPKYFLNKDDFFKNILIHNFIGGTSMVVAKRRTLLEVGLFDECLHALQDYELWMRLAKNKYNFFYLNKPLTKYCHITHKKSISKSFKLFEESNYYIVNKYHNDYKVLSREDTIKRKKYIYDLLIHKSYLNKNYIKCIYLNIKSLFILRDIRYLFGLAVSVMGSDFAFKLRALKDHFT